MDITGFELVKDITSLTNDDFYNNPDKIKSVYYNEMADLIKKVTGADDALVFHHQVR